MISVGFKDFINHFGRNENLKKNYSSTELTHIAKLFIEKINGMRYESISTYSTILFTTEQNLQWERMIQELITDKPYQYIIGETWFCEHIFKLNKDCLIPRPETEDMVLILKKYIAQLDVPCTIIDFCTGSGCIAISLKLAFPQAIVWATDHCEQALIQAQENANIHQTNIHFCTHDLLNENFDQFPKVDILVCNPPYIPLSKKDLLDVRVGQYEPEMALFVPNHDPLLFYKKLIPFIKHNMSDNKMVMVECEIDYTNAVYELFQSSFKKVNILKDRYQNKRFVMINNANLISLQ